MRACMPHVPADSLAGKSTYRPTTGRRSSSSTRTNQLYLHGRALHPRPRPARPGPAGARTPLTLRCRARPPRTQRPAPELRSLERMRRPTSYKPRNWTADRDAEEPGTILSLWQAPTRSASRPVDRPRSRGHREQMQHVRDTLPRLSRAPDDAFSLVAIMPAHPRAPLALTTDRLSAATASAPLRRTRCHTTRSRPPHPLPVSRARRISPRRSAQAQMLTLVHRLPLKKCHYASAHTYPYTNPHPSSVACTLAHAPCRAIPPPTCAIPLASLAFYPSPNLTKCIHTHTHPADFCLPMCGM